MSDPRFGTPSLQALLTGVVPGNPVATMSSIPASSRALSMAAGAGTPAPTPSYDPASGPPPESPLITGARLAGQARNPAANTPSDGTPDDPGKIGGISKNFLDSVKQYMGALGQAQPTEQDKNTAIALGGARMAASSSPYFGQALGEGLYSGIQSLQQAKSMRAEQAMKLAQYQNEADYRDKSLAQSGTFQTGELANMEDQRRLQQAQIDQAAKLQPSEIARNNAAVGASQADVNWRNAMTQQLTGTPGNIPASVLKIVGPIAQKQLASDPRYKDPDAFAAGYQQAIVPLAYNYMTEKGQSTDGIAAFDPYRVPAAHAAVTGTAPPSANNPDPAASNASPTVPWLTGNYAAAPNPPNKIPILGNPALTAPGAKIKDLAQSVSGGAYDAGQLFNMGEADLINLHTDLLDLAKKKAGGMGLGEAQANLIAQMIPHQKFIGSNPENSDQFQSIYNNVLQQYTADNRMLNSPATEKGMRKELADRASLESTILNNLAGSQTADKYPRWGAIGASGPSGAAAPVTPSADTHLDSLLAKYK